MSTHLDQFGNPMFPLACASCGKETGELVSGPYLAALENGIGAPWTCSRACMLQAEYAESLKERSS